MPRPANALRQPHQSRQRPMGPSTQGRFDPFATPPVTVCYLRNAVVHCVDAQSGRLPLAAETVSHDGETFTLGRAAAREKVERLDEQTAAVSGSAETLAISVG